MLAVVTYASLYDADGYCWEAPTSRLLLPVKHSNAERMEVSKSVS